MNTEIYTERPTHGKLDRVAHVAATALLGALVLVSCAGGPSTTGENMASSDGNFVLQGVTRLTQVAQLTGKNSMNHTDRYDVYGADLGSIISFHGKHYFVFGDTFGYRADSKTGAGGENWRSNVMAYTSDTNPADGITFDGMIVNNNGNAKELLGAKKVDNVEITVIPTYGISVGDNMYLFYMSVNHWGAAGYWYCNYSGVAKSTDGGRTWTKLDTPRWPGKSNFIQMAIYQQGDDLYFWSIPAGRHGGVALMRVPANNIEDMNEYRYFSGMKNGDPQWSASMDDAKLVVLPPVGELSVIYDNYLGRWIMTYLNEESHNLEIREGLNPWGPWGPAHELVSAADYPALYGAFMNPDYVEANGKTIYFTMSQFGPYNVFWMRADLVKKQ